MSLVKKLAWHKAAVTAATLMSVQGAQASHRPGVADATEYNRASRDQHLRAWRHHWTSYFELTAGRIAVFR